jgi:hypothetical protein
MHVKTSSNALAKYINGAGQGYSLSREILQARKMEKEQIVIR